MITYSPQDPTTEIIFNLGQVSYEKRNLVAPTDSFILGEWVGLGAGNKALKISSNSYAINPRMVWTETGRDDVADSEGVTVAYGAAFKLSTMNYAVGESFAVGSELVVLTSGGIGKLLKLPASTGSYWVVGIVTVAPAVDGVSRLVADIYATPFYKVVA